MHLTPRTPLPLELLFIQASPVVHTPVTHALKHTCPKLCTPQYPQVRRLSLPTTRERWYLKNTRVHRVGGRSLRQTQSRCFSLKIWPLVGMAPKPDPDQKMQLTSEDYLKSVETAYTETDYGFVDAPVLADEETLSHLNLTSSPVSNSASMTSFNPQMSRTTTPTVVSCQDTGSELLPTSQALIDSRYPSHAQLETLDESNGRPHPKLHIAIEPLHTPGLPSTRQQKWVPEITHIATVPPWAYTVIIRATKPIIGKRSVLRNRAKRRIRAAAAQILPRHASRQLEYMFTATPESLVIRFEELVEEVCNALKAVNCWEDNLTIEMIRREKYCER